MNTQHRIWSALLLLAVGLIPATALAAPPAPPTRLLHRLMIHDLESTEVARNPAPSPQSGPGAVIHVTTFDPNIAADGQCSLVEAIVNANNDAATHVDCTAGSGPDTIELPAGTYTLTLVNDPTSGGNGLPLITSTITINGHGSTITRSADPQTPQFRIVYITANGNLGLNNLTISHGAVATGISGGGIRSHGTLTLTNCAVDNNTAGAGGGILNGDGAVLELNNSIVQNNLADGNVGGGIYNRSSSAVLNNSVVQGNTSTGYALGGGILNWASGSATSPTTLMLNHTLVTNNTADGDGSGGGGVASSANNGKTAIVTLIDSSVIENQAQYGGGITFSVNDSPAPDSRGFIIRSTISHNHALDAGGVYADGGGIDVTASSVTVVNSTISGNDVGAAAASEGGGIWVGSYTNYPAGTLHLINSTVAGNTTTGQGGGIAVWADSPAANPPVVDSVNTIAANNTAPGGGNCWIGAGSITSLGYNMENTNTCSFSQATDHPNTNPQLGPLANNGGPTATHALLSGSPAIGAASNAVCAAAPVSGVDQRGVSRPQGAVCDIGAYEYQEVPTAVRGLGLHAQNRHPSTWWTWPLALVVLILLTIDVVASVSVFHDLAGAEESNRMAADWVRQEIASLMAGPPEITAGEVKAHQAA
jgi:hypothetical protein